MKSRNDPTPSHKLVHTSEGWGERTHMFDGAVVMRLFFKAILSIAGCLLVIIAIYGFYYFVKDMTRMAEIVGPDIDTSLLTPLNFPRPQLFIVGFVDSLQNFTLGLLAIFAATKITKSKPS